MPIHISEALLMGVAGADVPTLEQQLWIGSGGTCALCSEAIDREDDELEAGRDGAGGLHLSHARCHHDVVGDGDRVRLESELADNPAGYLKRRGWRKSRAKRVDPRVPLLRAGSERHWTWLVEGALADGSGVQLGCLAISFGGEGGEDHEGVFIEGDGEDLWTVVVLDADYPDRNVADKLVLLLFRAILALGLHSALSWLLISTDRIRALYSPLAFRAYMACCYTLGAGQRAHRLSAAEAATGWVGNTH
jgi:hypothetical protein